MMKCLRVDKDRDMKDEKSTMFLMNGSRLLEKMITFCNGKCCIPIKSFTVEELEKATNNFDKKQLLKIDGYFELYKGFLQDRPVIVKKFIIKQADQFSINEILYAAEEKTLADRIIDRDDMHFQPVPWNVRLKTAIDIANVVVYMHTAFPRPIVHRNIKASNVLLDGNSAAKLSDFSLCVSIPEGETYVEDIVAGTVGVIAPESLATGYFNEKNDVYSFGVLLLVLLTGQRSFDNSRIETGDEFLLVNHVKKYLGMNRFKEMFDPFILGEAVKEQQLESVGALAIKCIDDAAEKRPEMIEVAKELIPIYRSAIDPS
ncbi:serine/threonine-protein kinase ZRK1-like isoform X2 [Euphorbia lathyris]|uniref:serine/threonine-protein kinase ZRK1-like isoform X2 n=1 Tax=Euphorbia lathyris TaxID=212925 RepID=UPI00331312C2